MKRLRLTIIILALFGIITVRSISQSNYHESEYHADIAVNGNATFYRIDNGARKILWQVSCDMPLRSCRARSGGAVLSVTGESASLLFFASHETNLTMHRDHQSIPVSISALEHLDRLTIQQLNKAGTSIRLSQSNLQDERFSTEGMERTIQFLVWVESAHARTLRDARGWPKKGSGIDTRNLDEQTIIEYEEFRERYAKEQPKITQFSHESIAIPPTRRALKIRTPNQLLQHDMR